MTRVSTQFDVECVRCFLLDSKRPESVDGQRRPVNEGQIVSLACSPGQRDH